MRCDAMGCDAMWCGVVWCGVMGCDGEKTTKRTKEQKEQKNKKNTVLPSFLPSFLTLNRAPSASTTCRARATSATPSESRLA
jgi:hypothetical protein